MTRDEVKKLLAMVNSSYPTFKVLDKTATVDAWHWLLEDENANDIFLGFKTYCKSDTSGFAPSVSQLIGLSHKAEELNIPDAASMWPLVVKAISNSIYASEAEYEKLPPMVQKAVGSASQLRSWAMDENFNTGVEESNFKRQYREAVAREKTIRNLPSEMKERLGVHEEKLIGGK